MTGPANRGTGEAHADGEEGKPTARDATGAKQQGFKDEGGDAPHDKPSGTTSDTTGDEDLEESRQRDEEREHLRKQAGSSLP